MSKTIEEIKEEKSRIEGEFLRKLTGLEKFSEMRIDHVRVGIDNYGWEEEEQSRKDKKKLRKLQGVLDVVIELNIENDPRSIDEPAEISS